MSRVFSEDPKDSEFKQKVSDAVEEANDKGSATVKDADTDLELSKTNDGVEIKDKLNGETTVARENPNDANDLVLDAKETETPAEGGEGKEKGDEVTISEVKPDEEYEVKASDVTFSVKGNLKAAIKAAKKFGKTITFSDFPEADFTKQDGTVQEPARNVPANTGVVDPNKTGMPANRSFAETIEEAKKAAEEDPEGSILSVDNEDGTTDQYHCKKTDKGFSWHKLDPKTMTYSSEIPEDDIVANLDGTNMNPEQQVDPHEGREGAKANEATAENFSEALKQAEDSVEETGEPAIAKDDDKVVEVSKKEDGTFSYHRIDLKNHTFSETTKEELLKDENPDKGTNEECGTFAEALDKAEKSVEETGEPAIAQEDDKQVEVSKKEDGTFSYHLINLKNHTFSETTKDELLNDDNKEGTKTLDEQVSDLEDKADEVSKDPTSDNAQNLKKQAEDLQETIQKDESFSEFKKNSLIGRLKAFCDLVKDKPASKKGHEEGSEEGSEEDKGFSSLLDFDQPYKVFANKSEVEQAQQRTFAQGQQNNNNKDYDPCLDAQF